MSAFATLCLAAAVGAFSVTGNGKCPSARKVEQRVQQLSAGSVAGHSMASLKELPDGRLLLELRDESGVVLERKLPETASCEDRAEAAAVIIASELRRLEAGAPAPSLPPTTVLPSLAPWHLRWEVGAGLSGAFSREAVGALLHLALWPSDRRLGGALKLVYPGSDLKSLGPGQVWWSRPSLRLGPQYRLEGRRFVLHLQAEAIAALLAIQGRGFSGNRRAAAFDPGLGGSARAGVRLGRVAPWIALLGAGWLKSQHAAVEGSGGVLSLPRYEVLLVAGVAVEGP